MHDVTIELDFDDETWSDLDVLNDKVLEEDEDDVIISDPISLSRVVFKLPGSVKIRHLAQEVRDLIFSNLTVPPTVTIGSWQMVVDFLSASEKFQGDFSDSNHKDVWKPFNNLHAQILVNALIKVERIDILAKLKSLMETECLLSTEEERVEPVRHHVKSATTTIVPAPPFVPFDASKMILVLHYETTKLEKENYYWFWDNFTDHLKKKSKQGYSALDITKLKKNDGGNRIQMVEHVYPQFPHIVVCFNDSYIQELRKAEVSTKFKFCRSIHRKTDEEFVQNDNRNLRCRCVIMPQMTEKLITSWAMLTHNYHWPDDYDDFIGRILDLDNVKVRFATAEEEREKYSGKNNVTL
uniref:Crinkler (CRN) family protein n=1 Tax=Caenorhabditis tropicalis TaxID=1561998 RepID=A0A1I7TJ34_9PELO